MTKPADWKLKILADENHKLNKSYSDNNEFDKYNTFTKLKDVFNWVMRKSNIKTVLEVGCGAAWPAVYIKNILKNTKYTGFDISQAMCDYAKSNFPQGEFIVGDILTDILNKKFDIVLENAVIELVEDWKKGVIGMMKHSKEWLIFHRFFFQEDKTRLEKVSTYNNIPDIRWHVGLNDLKKILKQENFKIVFDDRWGCCNAYNIGTFVARRN